GGRTSLVPMLCSLRVSPCRATGPVVRVSTDCCSVRGEGRLGTVVSVHAATATGRGWVPLRIWITANPAESETELGSSGEHNVVGSGVGVPLGVTVVTGRMTAPGALCAATT